MKKTAKKKNIKVSGKRSAKSSVPLASEETELPSLVTAMTKLVERLGVLEQKMDQVLGRLSNLPSEIKNNVQPFQRSQPPQQQPQQSQPMQQRSYVPQPQPTPMPQRSQSPQAPYPQQQSQRSMHPSAPAHSHGQGQGHSGNRRERPLFQVICADCKKNCEIPFKPSEERPVYCKECFSLRKANRAPQNIGRSSAVAHLNKKAGFVSSAPEFRPQAAAPVSGNVAVLKTEKSKQAPPRAGSAKPKKKKR